MVRSQTGLAALLLAVLVACGRDRGGESQTGVSQNTRDALPIWTLEMPPETMVGSESGDGPDVFSKVAGAVRFADGRIVVADMHAGELRYFGPDGKFLRAVGRPGAGPGEFRALWWIGRCRRDSVYAYDLGLDRISVFDRDGHLGRTFTLHSPDPARSPGGFACDQAGEFIVSGQGEYQPSVPMGPYESTVPVALVNPLGNVAEVLGTFSGGERYRSERSDMPRKGGRNLVIGLGTDRAYVGTGVAFDVTILDLDGQRLGEITAPWTPSPISQDAWAAYVRSTMRPSWPDEYKARATRNLMKLGPPSSFPPYDTLVVDPAGKVWVRTFRTRPGPHRWMIFGRDGEALGQLRLPEVGADANLVEIDSDRVVMRVVDSVGVNYVGVYRLDRRGAGAK